MQRLIGWLFFNLLIGNNDSHAKNLATLYTDDGPRLAPFYDLMSTTLYSGLSSRFALSISGEGRPGHIDRSHLEALARALRFQPDYFLKQGLELAERMPQAIDATVASLRPVADKRNRADVARKTTTAAVRQLPKNAAAEGWQAMSMARADRKVSRR